MIGRLLIIIGTGLIVAMGNVAALEAVTNAAEVLP
jgi:hypothetical protein